MKILALAFIMALMFAVIGAFSSSSSEEGGNDPYSYQSNSQEYSEPIVYGRKQ